MADQYSSDREWMQAQFDRLDGRIDSLREALTGDDRGHEPGVWATVHRLEDDLQEAHRKLGQLQESVTRLQYRAAMIAGAGGVVGMLIGSALQWFLGGS